MKVTPLSKLLERMAADGQRGRLSRREFMRLSLAAGLTVASASALWSSSVLAATARKRAALFRLGMHDGNTSDTHDPGTYVSYSTIMLAHTFRSYLDPDYTRPTSWDRTWQIPGVPRTTHRNGPSSSTRMRRSTAAKRLRPTMPSLR